MFPDRVEKVIKQFQLIGNCNTSNYDWTRDTVAKVWVHILEAMVIQLRAMAWLSFTINDRTLRLLAALHQVTVRT